MDQTTVVAIIQTAGIVIVALIQALIAGKLNRIHGLVNGSKGQALEEIARIHAIRVATGQPTRRSTDVILEGKKDA